MQSIKNIYEKIYDFENLHKAWEEARKGKRYRDDVLIFNRNYEEQLINIQNHLIYETYEVGKYHTFYVYEPKKRLIMSLPFKDRIVQWAIYRQLFPLYEKTFIFDSYACRKGKERKLHTMYIDSAAIITIASVLGALTAIGAVAYKIIKWFQAQEKQTTDIEDLKKQEKEDIKAMEDELCLLTYAVLACLKGLKEQGCNGPVTEAIGKIEKHINQKAHGQET